MIREDIVARFLHEEVTEHGKRCEQPLLDLLRSINEVAWWHMMDAMIKHPPIAYDNLSPEVRSKYIQRANQLLAQLDDII